MSQSLGIFSAAAAAPPSRLRRLFPAASSPLFGPDTAAGPICGAEHATQPKFATGDRQAIALGAANGVAEESAILGRKGRAKRLDPKLENQTDSAKATLRYCRKIRLATVGVIAIPFSGTIMVLTRCAAVGRGFAVGPAAPADRPNHPAAGATA